MQGLFLSFAQKQKKGKNSSISEAKTTLIWVTIFYGDKEKKIQWEKLHEKLQVSN